MGAFDRRSSSHHVALGARGSRRTMLSKGLLRLLGFAVVLFGLSCVPKHKPTGDGTRVYLEVQVEKPAVMMMGSDTPPYPKLLLDMYIEGEVMAQFVVDTNGRVERNSVRILRSTHQL